MVSVNSTTKWILAAICFAYFQTCVVCSSIPPPGNETCIARDGCSQSCPDHHQCCGCAHCDDDDFMFGRDFCFCCPSGYNCCPPKRRGVNPTCCPGGFECGESNGKSVCLTLNEDGFRDSFSVSIQPRTCSDDGDLVTDFGTGTPDMVTDNTESSEQSTTESAVTVNPEKIEMATGEEDTSTSIAGENTSSDQTVESQSSTNENTEQPTSETKPEDSTSTPAASDASSTSEMQDVSTNATTTQSIIS